MYVHIERSRYIMLPRTFPTRSQLLKPNISVTRGRSPPKKKAIETIVAGGSLLQNDDVKDGDGDGKEGQGGSETRCAGENGDEHRSISLSHTQAHSPDEPAGARLSSTSCGTSERERERERGAQGKSGEGEREGALGNGIGGGKEGGGSSGGGTESAAKAKSKLQLKREARAAKEVCV